MERLNSKGPDLKFWERFSSYKYTILALSVVLLFFTMPLLEHEREHFLPFLFLPIMAAVLWTLGLHRGLLVLCLALGFLGFGFHLIVENIGLSGDVSRVLEMAEMGVYKLFYGICLLVFLHRIFSETTVTADTIQGGIAVYFLSGLLWAFFYQTLILQYFGQFFCERLKKIIDKKVPFTQIGCQRFSESKTIQTSETAQWNWQKRYSIGSTFANPKKSFSSPFLPPYSLHEAKSIFATFHAIPITVSAHTPVNLTNPLTLWGSTVPSSMNV